MKQLIPTISTFSSSGFGQAVHQLGFEKGRGEGAILSKVHFQPRYFVKKAL